MLRPELWVQRVGSRRGRRAGAGDRADAAGRRCKAFNRVLTPKLGAYAGLAALGLIASLVLGFPELVAVAAPFALVAGAGLALAETPDPDVSLELERERAIRATS